MDESNENEQNKCKRDNDVERLAAVALRFKKYRLLPWPLAAVTDSRAASTSR